MDTQTFLREIVTGVMSVVITIGAVYSVLAGRPDGVLLDTMTGAVLAFYFTRGAVQAGQAGIKEAHQEAASTLKEAHQEAASTLVEAVKAASNASSGHGEIPA